MESLTNLIIPLMAIIILSSIIDQVTKLIEAIMHSIPGLPDEFEWYIGYIIVIAISFFITGTGGFDLFSYFGFKFIHPLTGEFITALVISGGSTFVGKQFTLIARIPELIMGLSSANRSSAPRVNNNETITNTEVKHEEIIANEEIANESDPEENAKG